MTPRPDYVIDRYNAARRLWAMPYLLTAFFFAGLLLGYFLGGRW